MGYSQEYVNVISAATYIGAAIAQIALGFEQTRNPIRTMLLCQLCVPLGFFGTFATVRFDLPWATMVVSDALLAFGVAGMCLPMLNLVTVILVANDTARYGDEATKRGWTTYVLTEFFGLYGAVGLVFAAVYWYAPGGSKISLKHKLENALLACVVISAISFVAVVLWSVRIWSKKGAVITPHPQSLGLSALRPILRSKDFWLALGILTVTFGLSVNFCNNAGSMSIATNGPDASGSLFIVFSACQTITRLASQFFLNENNTTSPRRALMLLAMNLSGLLITGAVSLLWFTTAGIYSAAVFNGLAYGTNWVLTFGLRFPHVLIGTDPGDKTYDTLVMACLGPAPFIGPVIADYLSGALYDQKANSVGVCQGADCYKTYLVVHIVLSIVGLFLLSLLFCQFRRRKILVVQQPESTENQEGAVAARHGITPDSEAPSQTDSTSTMTSPLLAGE